MTTAGASQVFAQDPVELRGEAILKHPIGSLAIKAAELMSAGNIDQAVQLGTQETSRNGRSLRPMRRRIQGADIPTHPIGALALQYSDLVHAGKMDDVMRLATAEAQAKWKWEPASERAESAAYRRKTLPKRAALTAAIPSGGLLIIEDDALASLNLIQSEQSAKTPGVVTSTSTTTSIGFALEDGQWKLTQ